MDKQTIIDLLKVAWPLLLLQFGFQVYTLLDLFSKKKTRNLTPAIWTVIIILGEFIGPILYFIFGRKEE